MFRLDQEYPEVRRAIVEDRDLTIDEMVKKYTFAKDVPYWGGNAGIHSRLVEIRTNPEEILQVPPIASAIESLNRIHERVPVKCYFSTRPQSLWAATSEWLKQNGFPQAELILTPDDVPNREADQWKVDLISKRLDISGIIDNSNEVVSLFPDDYHGIVFHFGTSVSPANKNYEIISCPEWRHVERGVNREIGRLLVLSP